MGGRGSFGGSYRGGTGRRGSDTSSSARHRPACPSRGRKTRCGCRPWRPAGRRIPGSAAKLVWWTDEWAKWLKPRGRMEKASRRRGGALGFIRTGKFTRDNRDSYRSVSHVHDPCPVVSFSGNFSPAQVRWRTRLGVPPKYSCGYV